MEAEEKVVNKHIKKAFRFYEMTTGCALGRNEGIKKELKILMKNLF